jgi:tetratricopeptide (TPR) repeat protein
MPIRKASAIEAIQSEAENAAITSMQSAMQPVTGPAVSNNRQLRVHVEQTFQIARGLHNDGKLREADRLYQFILAERPSHYGSLFCLGLLRAQADQMDQAVNLFGRAVAAEPNSADALGWFGITLAALDRLDEALAYYHKALSIDSQHVVVHNALGMALRKCGRIEQAVFHFERAIAIKADYASARLTLADMLQDLGRVGEALMHYDKVLAVQPRNYTAHNNRGTAFNILGRIEDAGRAYEKALQFAPREASIHHNLAHLRRFTPGDSRLAALEKLAEDMAALDAKNQISLHFALAKALGDLGQYERSFRHMGEGNSLKRAQLAYDEEEALSQLGLISTTFTPELIQQKSGGGYRSETPVFIVGMPRSGTTLVEQILASHSKVFGAGEIETFSQVIVQFRSQNSVAASFPEMVSAMSLEALHHLGSNYIELTKSAAPAVERIVDKLPQNFKYVGLIHLALPNARIIHVRRDPLDTCFSCFSLLFSGDQSFTYDLGELGRYYLGYATLMQHWRRVLPHSVMIDVQYEDLVADLDGQARAIVDHCGLEWEDACLAFHQTQRQVKTASSVQVREPIYRTSVGRWRQYENFLGPLIEALKAPDGAGMPCLQSPESSKRSCGS